MQVGFCFTLPRSERAQTGTSCNLDRSASQLFRPLRPQQQPYTGTSMCLCFSSPIPISSVSGAKLQHAFSLFIWALGSNTVAAPLGPNIKINWQKRDVREPLWVLTLTPIVFPSWFLEKERGGTVNFICERLNCKPAKKSSRISCWILIVSPKIYQR